MSYVVERDVVTVDSALKVFSGLIFSEKNKSPFKDKEFIANIAINTNNADMDDYSSVRMDVFREKNASFQSVDTTNRATRMIQSAQAVNGIDKDSRINQNRVEYKYYVSNQMMVLTLNDYPVYIGENIFGFINYAIRPTSNSDVRM